MQGFMTKLVGFLAAVTVAGCGGDMGMAPPPAGAVPGGAQDVGLARDKIARGIVPVANDFTVEGMFAEHDLPIEGAPCEHALCVRAALGVAHAFDVDRRQNFVQIGLSSNIDLTTFRRRPQNLAVVIDRSGSMTGAKFDAAKTALRKLVDQLDGEDVLTLVQFDDEAEVIHEPAPVTDREAIKRIIDRMETRGGTCIECGMREGYRWAEIWHAPYRSSRVLLITDAQPNVGATGDHDFITLVTTHAERVGLTAFGVGIDFGQSLALAISRVRGGNYFFLENAEKLRKVFDEEFDLLVTPIAYDLRLQLSAAAGFTTAAVHGGAQGWQSGDVEIRVPTVFLSRRRGAILARLDGEPRPMAPVASAILSYADVSASPVQFSLQSQYEGAEPLPAQMSWFSQSGVRKTVALTNFVLGAQKVCRLWHEGNGAAAATAAVEVRDYLKAEAEAQGDAGLRAEAALAASLAALVDSAQ